jgi:hypothetical protein
MVVGAVGRQLVGGGFRKDVHKVMISLRDLGQLFFGRGWRIATVFEQAIYLVEAGTEELVGLFPEVEMETHGTYRSDV